MRTKTMAKKKKKRPLDDSDFYFLSDQTIELLDKKAVKRFERAKTQCGILKIDELNVIKVCKKLYENLAADNKKAFLQLAVYMYRWAWIKGRKKHKKEPDAKWLEAILNAYNPITKYIYTHEVERKRDYTAEAVIASPTKEYEFRRGLSYWSRMTAHYADTVADQAALKAFKDADVKKVMWISQRDDRVCVECKDRDGRIYPIDQVPPKPHVNCRCYLQPVPS